MAWVDTATKRTFSGNSAVTITDSGTMTVSVGDFVVIGVASARPGGPQPTLTVSDDLSNTWDNSTEAVSYDSGSGTASTIRWSTITTGGSMKVSVTGNGTNTYGITAFMHVFQNPHATPASGSGVGSTGSVSPMDTTAVTPADNDVLVIGSAALAASRTITENNATGDTDWTLSNEQESAASCAGSMVFKIMAGAPGTPRAAWTLSSGAGWAARAQAFKPAASAAALTVVGRTTLDYND